MNSSTTKGRGALVLIGASLAALVSSACCWLPLLLISLGVSSAGLSATFEKWRPLFLGVTFCLLGVGFYLTYFRGERCAPDSSCEQPRTGLRRLNRMGLWFGTAFVLASAFFPNYIGLIATRSVPAKTYSSASEEDILVRLDIEGMTCAGCIINVKSALYELPGVVGVSVGFESAQAIVNVDARTPPSEQSLRDAVHQAGFSVSGANQTALSGKL